MASLVGATSVMVTIATPASADQISDAQAQAAAITAKLNATEAQIAALTGQVNQADYKLAQLKAQIAASQAQMAKDQRTVASDEAQLRTQAIADYTSSGTSNTATQLFTSNVNTSGIRSEYSSIATGNVTSTIDHLHTAQAQLAATQSSLEQQQDPGHRIARAQPARLRRTRRRLWPARTRRRWTASTPTSRPWSSSRQAAQAAAAQAAAQAAFNQKVAGGQGGPGGPGGGSASTQHSGVRAAPARAAPAAVAAVRPRRSPRPAPPPPLSAGAAGAVQAAEREIGVPYVWGGTTPAGFDCSGLVMWAYAQVGISLPHYSGAQYADTTHIPMADIEPGDLLFYGPGGSDHVAMYVGGGSDDRGPLHRGQRLDHRSPHLRPRRRRPGGLSRVTPHRRSRTLPGPIAHPVRVDPDPFHGVRPTIGTPGHRPPAA